MRITEGISHPVFYGDLVYKLRRVRCEANFVSSGSKIVRRLRRPKYDPLIIERTIGLVLGPSTALYRSFRTHCILTNKAVGTIWPDLSKPPQRRQGPDPRPLWLWVGTPLVLGPERAEHSLLWWMSLYVLDKLFYHLICLCNNFYGLSALVGCWSLAFIRRIIYEFFTIFNRSFWWRFCVVTLVFGFFCQCRGFCHRTESDLFLFLFICL